MPPLVYEELGLDKLLEVQVDAAEEIIYRRKLRKNLAPYIKGVLSITDPGAVYKHNWHIDAIAEYTQAVFAGQIRKLIINVPPRTLKSSIVSVGAPSWSFGQDPTERFLTASGASTLATKHSLDCRLILRSQWYKLLFPKVELRADQDQKNRFETTAGGHRIAIGAGASIVGQGGRIKIIDDPIDPEKTLRPKPDEIIKINTWYDQTWSQRSDDQTTAKEILVMQRLHIDDLTGHLINQDTGWEVLVLPQEGKGNTVISLPISKVKINRKDGEFLQVERFGEEEKKITQKILGSHGYAGQHQQEPVQRGGNRIKAAWFGKHSVEPIEYEETVISIDTANKAKEIHDPTVMEIYGRVGKTWYLREVVREHLAYPDLKKTFFAVYHKYKPDFVLIEDKASGTQLLQEAQEMNFPVVPIEPEADKITRMELQLGVIESGLISLPDPLKFDYGWIHDLDVELSQFPDCVTWDQIDAMSQFVKWVRSQDRVLEIW